MLTAERKQTTAPATADLKQIRIPTGEYKIGSHSFFEALLDVTAINPHPKRCLLEYAKVVSKALPAA